MPATFSNLVPVRRVAVGDCSGPLGSGFDALARSAYTALLRAEWTQSADPPFLPVHDNGQTANKTIPRGDAWKCSYGYDAAARTERSACGAVCYTFALPSDATAGTPANISTVALSLTGDRYLDAGVDLYLVPSASPTPPTITEIIALTPVGTYCATSDQSPTPPNERHGVTEAVSATPGVAAQPYLHIALLLHDYTTNRGAWIEGGAMLEGATATITFSREVAGDASATYNLDLGPTDQTASGVGRQEIIAAPRGNFQFTINAFNASSQAFPVATLANPSGEAVALMLSPSAEQSSIADTAPLSNWTAEYDVVYVSPSNSVVQYCRYNDETGDPTTLAPTIVAVVRSGIVPDGVYKSLALGNVSSALPMPIRIAVYGLSRAPYHLKPAATVFDPSFWIGGVSSISAVSAVDAGSVEVAASKFQQFDPAPTTTLSAEPLALLRFDAGEPTPTTIPIDWTIAAHGAPVAVLLAIRPDVGAPTLDGARFSVPDIDLGLRP